MIGSDGKVTAADFVVADQPVEPDATQKCIIAIVSGLSFPALNAGTLVVRYPLNDDGASPSH